MMCLVQAWDKALGELLVAGDLHCDDATRDNTISSAIHALWFPRAYSITTALIQSGTGAS